MIRALALVLALGGVAHAAPVTPPAGWTPDPELATAPQTPRFGGVATKVTVLAYRAPVTGAVLYVDRAEAELPAERRDALASAELEELRNAMRRQGASAKAETHVQRFDPATKLLEAALTWRDAAVGLVESSRVVIASDGPRTVAVAGTCVLAADVAAAVAKACDDALATLDPEVPVAARVALAIVDAPAAAPPGPAPSSEAMSASPQLGPPATLDDGSRVVLPPITVPQTARTTNDRRPVYVGLGLIVLALAFYWNRRQRERFEREDAGEPAGPPTARTVRDRDGDADADDLHAAATAADAPSEPTKDDK